MQRKYMYIPTTSRHAQHQSIGTTALQGGYINEEHAERFYDASTESLADHTDIFDGFRAQGRTIRPISESLSTSTASSPVWEFERPRLFSVMRSRPDSGYTTAADQSGDEKPLKRFKAPQTISPPEGTGSDTLVDSDHSDGEVVELHTEGEVEQSVKPSNYIPPNIARINVQGNLARLRESSSIPSKGPSPRAICSFAPTSGLCQSLINVKPKQQGSLDSSEKSTATNNGLDAIFRAIEASDATKRQSILVEHLDKIWKILPPPPPVQKVDARRIVKVVHAVDMTGGEAAVMDNVDEEQRMRDRLKSRVQETAEKIKRRFMR